MLRIYMLRHSMRLLLAFMIFLFFPLFSQIRVPAVPIGYNEILALPSFCVTASTPTVRERDRWMAYQSNLGALLEHLEFASIGCCGPI
ncbi:hypothetical protein BDR03DRAFT_966018, partial [Suillus americanus]